MLVHLSERTIQAVLATADSSDPGTPLGKAIHEALGVIDGVLEDFGEGRLAISFNGGKDCTVLLHLLSVSLWKRRSKQQLPHANGDPSSSDNGHTMNGNSTTSSTTPFKSLYVTCKAPFPEVEAFVDQCALSYSLDLYRTNPGGLPMKEALRQYQGLEPAIKGILIGTRRDDPHGAKLTFRAPTDEGWAEYERVHPIINWTYAQIWEYLRKFEVPYCDLYNQGYTSLGSQFNTSPNPELKDDKGGYLPAYELKDGSLERCGRSWATPAI